MLARLFTINFFDSFIAGIITVVVPLIMASRGIELESIGLIFALSYVVKPVVRVFAAVFADSFGERANYVLGSACNIVKAAAYALSSTPPGFIFGKVCDAVRESLIWSVNRPSVAMAAPHKGHFALGGLVSGRIIYNALGSLSIGFLFSFGGYEFLFSTVAAVAFCMLALSLGVKDTHAKGTKIKLSDLSPFGKSRLFYEISGALLVGSVFYNAVLYMLLPLYFSSLGFQLGEIGVLYSAYFITNGALLNLLSHKKASSKKAAYAGALAFSVSLLGMGLGGRELLPAFFILMAVGDACLGLLWEELNWKVVANERKKKATELALANMPSYIGVGIMLAVSGFAVSLSGYLAIFLLCAASEVAFAAWCIRINKVYGG